MVGVDIGCGMLTVRIAERDVDFARLDALIRAEIPSGRDIREEPHPYADRLDLSALRCADRVNMFRAPRSISTLGGGNHFIELDRDAEGNVYVVVHSGSRHLGHEVADFYTEQGQRALFGTATYQIAETIARLKAEGRHTEIQPTLRAMKARTEALTGNSRDLAYVEGQLFADYIHDMRLTQQYAELNRQAMMDAILLGMGFTEVERFTTVHNYIDTDSMILRKGAVSAKAGEKLLIPINMRDGALICIGKGNEDWNCSAPHGAGRLMSRSAAFKRLDIEEYRAQMAGIYSTCVTPDTLDESPMAYKPIESILSHVTPTVDVVTRITPIFNFKATEEA